FINDPVLTFTARWVAGPRGWVPVPGPGRRRPHAALARGGVRALAREAASRWGYGGPSRAYTAAFHASHFTSPGSSGRTPARISRRAVSSARVMPSLIGACLIFDE